MPKAWLLISKCFLIIILHTHLIATESVIAGDHFHLSVSKGLVSFDAKDARLQSVLDAFAEKTGVKISSYENMDNLITLSFQNLTIEKAIQKIAGNVGITYIKKDGNNAYQLSEALIAGSLVEGSPKTEIDINNPISGNHPQNRTGIPFNMDSAGVDNKRPGSPSVVAGELIVRFRADVPKEEITAVIAKIGAVIKNQIDPLNYYVLALPENISVVQALEWLRGQKSVVNSEPSYLIPLQFIPNDKFFPFQWALNNVGQIGGTPSADIDMAAAWDLEKGFPGVVIAIIDTGIDYVHEDLAGNIWQNPGEIPGNGIDDDQNGYVDDNRGWDFVNTPAGFEGEDFSNPDNDPMDRQGHGTMIAGVVAASGNNQLGIAGVTWNCRIMPVRVGFKSASGRGLMHSSQAAHGIVYAVQNGAHVINLSWGSSQKSSIIESAIAYATTNGAIVCVSAGNQNSNIPIFPAGIENDAMISVGASDSHDSKAFFSNFGTWVDVYAPGLDIVTTYLTSSYVVSGGTSIATAFVSGVAGLIWSLNPGSTNLEVKRIIIKSTDTLHSIDETPAAGGRVNARTALSYAVHSAPATR